MKKFMKRIIKKLSILFAVGYTTVDELKKHGATVGENCYLYTNKIDLPHAHLIQIGNHVTISDARLLAHDASTKRALGYTRVGRIVIGDNVFIGAGALVLPNVAIGNDVVIGAGAVVASDIPSNSVAVGSPAKVICTYESFIEKNIELMKSGKVYDTHYSQKSSEDIRKMQDDLMDGGIGFDI
ncbi:MAG: acyltransferase [Clostridiales bacterium]|nr:acyltransferase [Clostridiales bacterium]